MLQSYKFLQWNTQNFTKKVYEKGERTIMNGLGNFSVSCKSLMHKLVSFAIIPCFEFLLKSITIHYFNSSLK